MLPGNPVVASPVHRELTLVQINSYTHSHLALLPRFEPESYAVDRATLLFDLAGHCTLRLPLLILLVSLAGYQQ